MSLQIRQLGARYGRLRILEGIDLSATPDNLLVLLGPNGAGKSTLLGAIAGLVESTGEVAVAGRPLQGLPASERARRGIALVPEGRGNLFGSLTVADNLALALALSPSRERAQRREQLFGLFPLLRERLRQRAGMLSGGEQQMLAIAVALAHGPQVLMLDEPTQGLAPVALDGLADAIRALRAFGLTVLLAEQNVAFARRVADRYVVLREGRLGVAGPATDLDDVQGITEQLV